MMAGWRLQLGRYSSCFSGSHLFVLTVMYGASNLTAVCLGRN
jgi:hypothetical protein